MAERQRPLFLGGERATWFTIKKGRIVLTAPPGMSSSVLSYLKSSIATTWSRLCRSQTTHRSAQVPRGLPLELVESIYERLEWREKVAFAQTCSDFYYLFGRDVWVLPGGLVPADCESHVRCRQRATGFADPPSLLKPLGVSREPRTLVIYSTRQSRHRSRSPNDIGTKFLSKVTEVIVDEHFLLQPKRKALWSGEALWIFSQMPKKLSIQMFWPSRRSCPQCSWMLASDLHDCLSSQSTVEVHSHTSGTAKDFDLEDLWRRDGFVHTRYNIHLRQPPTFLQPDSGDFVQDAPARAEAVREFLEWTRPHNRAPDLSILVLNIHGFKHGTLASLKTHSLTWTTASRLVDCTKDGSPVDSEATAPAEYRDIITLYEDGVDPVRYVPPTGLSYGGNPPNPPIW